ncbi:protein FAM83G [Clarias gariepinus]
MAESQLVCLDDGHVNVRVPESRPEFYYSEEQRAALELLLRDGDGAFKLRLRADNIKDFLSAREVKWIRETFREYDPDPDPDPDPDRAPPRSPRGSDSGVHSTYWPTVSDTQAPALELGWTTGGFYRGVTRVSVYTHPPKESEPHIKEVVRRLIQEAHKTLAVVMDLLTDLLILQDLLDAASKRGVAVYLLLDESGLPHFLDMCNRLQISAQHLRNMRVRMVRGCGLALSFGKLPGSMCSKYMLVDGEKVMFGSYSFTWTSSRMNRNTITVMSGQVVEFFDHDFRELYAVSEKVDLYYEFHIPKPPRHTMPTPLLKAPPTATQPALPASTSRFQVSLGDSKQVNLKVPAHKYHNPKYALVVGNSLGMTGSLQDLTRLREYAGSSSDSNMEKLLHTRRGTKESSDTASKEEMSESKEDVNKSPLFGSKKQRSSFRLFLKGRSPNQSPDLKTTNHNHNISDVKTANHSQAKPTEQVKDSPKLTNRLKDTSKSANNIKDTSKPANPITETSKPASNIKETPKPTSNVKETSKPTSNVKHSPKSSNHMQESPTPPNHIKDTSKPTNYTKESQNTANHVKEVRPANSQIPNGKHAPSSPLQETPESTIVDEVDDSFVIIEKPNVMKFKSKKTPKAPQRSMSMQVISTGAEEGFRGQKRSQKKTCIQS